MLAKPVDVGPFKIGHGESLALIAGPCVIESADHCLLIARRVADICRRLGLNYIFKASFDKANRTSAKSFRGPGLESGLNVLSRVREKVGVPVLTDVHSEHDASVAAEVVDVLQIPAFLCRQTDLVGAAARTHRMRIGPMGYVVPLYHPLRLAEEIALVDQMVGGRMELGLVPGINPDYFKPFGLDYNLRKSPTLEFVEYLRAAYGEKQPFAFHGDAHHTDSAQLAVQPLQRPHPPLWMMSRDPQTLLFCARHEINPGYFLVYPRVDAALRYRKFLSDWAAAGWPQPPKIAYCTIVYVDESDEKALATALARAARAYEGFLPPPRPGETFEQRAREHAKKFIGRGEPGASEIMANLFNADYLMKHELVFIGSPETVITKIQTAAQAGLFNVFMGEFNFSDLPEVELMRSICLFGEKVIPALRAYEPF